MSEIIKKIVEDGRRSLPIMNVEGVESTPYALRLTPFDKYGDDQLLDFLGFRSFFQGYIMVKETSKKSKEHYHIVLWSHMNEDDVRQQVREFLEEFFPEPAKRGDANKRYNLSEVESIELSIAYLLKDSTEFFTSPNIDRDYVESLRKKSYKKFSKEDFAKELELLKAAFKENDTILGDMMISIIQLKSLYRQPINLNYIHQMCLSYHIHNRPSRAGQIVLDFLSRYN